MDLKCVPYNYIYSSLKVHDKYYIKKIESAVSQDWPFMAYMVFCYVLNLLVVLCYLYHFVCQDESVDWHELRKRRSCVKSYLLIFRMHGVIFLWKVALTIRWIVPNSQYMANDCTDFPRFIVYEKTRTLSKITKDIPVLHK